MFVSILVFLSGFITFTLNLNFLLSAFLSLEVMGLSLFSTVAYFSYFLGNSVLVFFLTFLVCEGSVSLGVLVKVIRNLTTSSVYLMNFLKW